ncbi:META domain-containing protein [Novosphingobium sp. G106]|uniref:META domain-containing protein n=1 Tax=Novosphingobium sp. G106 TaxID=2849500 RepID=UPI001C2DCB2C|nr:META domain-containing protein [Novosphingobium sp. G106]MBV1688068.1 META domain-containing protein [Novosphingobium sp. G106]
MRQVLLPLASLALLAGCTTTEAGTSTPSLGDSEWKFTAIDGAPPVGEATLSFQGERLSANAGCNRMGGTWRSEGGKLVAGPLMATKMFCEGKMDQERAVSELLGNSPDLELSADRMTLKNTAHSAELVRK